MDKLVLFNESNRNSLVNKRPDESKFGEHIHIIPHLTGIYEQLINLDVQYVIFGIPEDIGVFANHGKIGTSNAWNACLKVLLNIQSNKFTHPNKVLILGYLDFFDDMHKLKSLNQSNSKDIQKARKLVKNIDKHVSELVALIIKAGKTPIIIGGGHNNAYGNIKGASLALKKPINVINFDAHSDFRTEEGRHSGNGFSYAVSEGFLKKYFIFGLHENYTSDAIFTQLEENRHIEFNTFEAIEVRKELKFKSELKRALQHINSKPYGIELDCDAIQNTPSSAMTPSGFSMGKARAFLNTTAQNKHAMYLHLCEAAPTPDSENQVGKLLTYLITDFIRAHTNA
ncbi:formiminoglutamase [Bizionia echini]|uniref:Formiminoglutamase n=1 Tax=Bizionia echini TaxID=649333 RepID=A0A1I5APX2_9FLAO|nr:formimidoylglutamase [Bizionia echini]SFN64487.1 formiminoglutamase [Bizionia echini]